MIKKLKDYFYWLFLIGWVELSVKEIYTKTELRGWIITFQNKKTKEIREIYSEYCP